MRSIPALVKLFEESGFTLLRSKNHLIWGCPCGHTQIVGASTHAEGRADNNCRARIKRTLRECAQRTEGTTK